MRYDLLRRAGETRKKIERFLATSKRKMTLTQIAKELGLPISTVKRHLDKLVRIGRVHVEDYGAFKLYYWNGEDVYQFRIRISDDHVIFVDAMVNPWGRPFLRLKEARRNPVTKRWEEIGAVIVDKERVRELAQALLKASRYLEKYGEEGD